jgi:hypothetical protein
MAGGLEGCRGRGRAVCGVGVIVAAGGLLVAQADRTSPGHPMVGLEMADTC